MSSAPDPSPGAVWRADEWAVPGVEAVSGDVVGALEAARLLADVARGLAEDPWAYLATLATLGAGDLTAARAAEPHLDAVAILAQAGDPDLGRIGAGPASTFGVYAARAPGATLRVEESTDGPRVSGTKAWCSLPGTVSHALVTVDEGDRPGLYAVPLDHAGVDAQVAGWASLGLRAVSTGPVTFTDVPAVPVGDGSWYLERPGFAWGGIGVAAVWFGGAAAVAGRLLDAAARRTPDQVALVHLGTVDTVLHAALLSLREAARAIAAGEAAGAAGSLVAARTRAVVADACDVVLREVGHGLGPAPLTHDEEHARRVADLTVYLRQHHALRDRAALGGLLLAEEAGR
ncbi:MAG: acyl-CoA dehydrogenase [Micrococcales bacterium]|nr:acyl-CoA dehydrogenase [Micrococcales bacterium]